MTFRMLIEKPELFAAGVAFIASLPENYDRLQRPSTAKPLMMCNGTADPLIKWQGGDVGRNRGRTCPIEAAVNWWIETNQCEPKPKSVAKLADNDKSDGCRVVHQIYAPKTGGSAFEFVKIVGGGHTLPSIQYSLPDKRLIQRLIGPMCHDIEGAEMAWEFMKKHRRSANLIN
jgi:poly(3-hydroxybutyrate) depolymerase